MINKCFCIMINNNIQTKQQTKLTNFDWTEIEKYLLDFIVDTFPVVYLS